MAGDRGKREDKKPIMTLSAKDINNPVAKKIEELSGQNIYQCYQCGKCSAGCPFSCKMDILPSLAIRLLQLGQVEEVLDRRTMWICSSCLTCEYRCPKGVDPAKIMEALRATAFGENKDFMTQEELSKEELEDTPQMGLISAFRKLTR